MLCNGIAGVNMSSRIIPDELLEQLRNNFDIVDVIGQYVALKKSGRNYVGLCPFHSEKTPSFSVSPEKQIYHCFGCGAGGDILRFKMEIDQLTFIEVVENLAQEAEIKLPHLEKQHSVDPNDQKKSSLKHAYELASKLYQYLLLETDHGHEGIQYLTKRGFSRELIEVFKIGYAPPGWDTIRNFLQKRGVSLETLKQSGLVNDSEDGNLYDRFRNRIVFPINDANGKTIAFGGRVLDDSLPKYLNSPETLIFNKSKTLYNLDIAKKEIRKTGQVVLFEGYVDTISAWSAGVNNGVATLGTSLTEQQAQIIRRNATEVIICYDSDPAGQQATYRAIEILHNAGLNVKVAQMPKNYDPDDYIKELGSEAFVNNVIKNTLTATSFKLHYTRKDFQLNNDNDRMKYLTQALNIIVDLSHAIEREHYLKELSEEFQISLQSLKNDMNQIYFEKRKKKEKTRDNLTFKWNNNINNGNHVGRLKTLYPAYYNAEKFLISFMMKDRYIAEKVQKEIGSDFHVEDFAVLAAYIYSYYGEYSQPDIRKFLSTLEDPHYIKLATKLAMTDLNENISEHELNDYILQVKNYKFTLLIKEKKEEQLRAEREGDIIKAAQLGQEIIQLRYKLRGKL